MSTCALANSFGLRLVLAAGLCLGLAGCSSQPPARSETSQAASPASQPEAARYDLKGKVVSVDKAGKRLIVDHEAIPGFMGAMTMAYAVKDDRGFDTVSPGDQITAKVVSSGGSFWLEDVKVASHQPDGK